MTRTVAYYNFEGTSKAKTANAILFVNEATGKEVWLPTRVVSYRFIGPNFRVRVSIPDWLSCKLDWRDPVKFTPKSPAKPTNPYVGCDVGNMMEERMVIDEQLNYVAKGSPVYTELVNRIRMIDEAAALA